MNFLNTMERSTKSDRREIMATTESRICGSTAKPNMESSSTIHMIGDTIKLTTLWGASAIAGTLASNQIDQTTHIPIGVALTVCGTVATAAFWISRKLTKIDDRMDNIDNKLNSLYCVRKGECRRKANDGKSDPG